MGPDGKSCDIRIVQRAAGAARGDSGRLRSAVKLALRADDRPSADVTVVLVNDAEMATLHHRHLAVGGTTDVITLDYRDHPSEPLVGELFLCVDEARRQATQRGHSLTAELCLYAIHGTLHLLGYDDQGAAAADRMHAREDELLTQLGFGPVFASI